MKTQYCENELCECTATDRVRVSVKKASDGWRWLCAGCYEVYYWGVQHGRTFEAACHGVAVDDQSSQDKPKKLKKIRLTKTMIETAEKFGIYL